jgi:hypothetical protein
MSDWRADLGSTFRKSEKRVQRQTSEMLRFINDIVIPAFTELRDELVTHRRDVTIRQTDSSVGMIVHFEGEEEITFRVQSRTYPSGIVPYADLRYRERRGLKFVRTESLFRAGKQNYTVADVTKDEVIQSFLKHYLPLLQRE